MPVSEQEVEVLEGLPQQEGFHHVPRPDVERVADVPDRGVAAAHATVVLDALRNNIQLGKIHLVPGQMSTGQMRRVQGM